jgi:hypothetical protein
MDASNGDRMTMPDALRDAIRAEVARQQRISKDLGDMFYCPDCTGLFASPLELMRHLTGCAQYRAVHTPLPKFT